MKSIHEKPKARPARSESVSDEDTIRLRLTKADLTFICESMSANVPCSEDMTPEELETYDKCVSAKLKIAKVT